MSEKQTAVPKPQPLRKNSETDHLHCTAPCAILNASKARSFLHNK